MASEVQPAHEVEKRPSEWPRGWLNFEEYRLVHDRYLEDLFRRGYVESTTLRFTILSHGGIPQQVRLEGELRCSVDVVLAVTKFMAVRDGLTGLEVISTYYRYHAWRPSRNSEQLIRYDQGHDAIHPHYHRFSADGDLMRYDDLTLDAMPRLDAVVREAVDLARERDATIRG